ncbi:hypothetical protein [Rugamonas apoptosis]|uniref:Uncharacterized protein n=1 Tax=Rugamonas apoptosis TaxID=2758570 RepID=A0A7W2FFC4_9BURK|nr:hypothetical protein [Rugamonas apoptosis]MBA5690614.1 hypothetical protein [Rugamonas apoptosis]
MHIRQHSIGGALALAACLQGVAYGEAADTSDIAQPAIMPITAPGPVPVTVLLPVVSLAAATASGDADDAPFGVAPLAADRLAQLRGGTDTVWNDMKLNGAVAGNTAVNVATGANIITNGSFSNASGLPVAIQNSGANVLIQNATIINVQLQ